MEISSLSTFRCAANGRNTRDTSTLYNIARSLITSYRAMSRVYCDIVFLRIYVITCNWMSLMQVRVSLWPGRVAAAGKAFLKIQFR